MTAPDWSQIDTDPEEEVGGKAVAWWFIWGGAVCSISGLFGLPHTIGWAGLTAGVFLLIAGVVQLVMGPDPEVIGPASDDDPEIPSW